MAGRGIGGKGAARAVERKGCPRKALWPGRVARAVLRGLWGRRQRGRVGPESPGRRGAWPIGGLGRAGSSRVSDGARALLEKKHSERRVAGDTGPMRPPATCEACEVWTSPLLLSR